MQNFRIEHLFVSGESLGGQRGGLRKAMDSGLITANTERHHKQAYQLSLPATQKPGLRGTFA
jgi:hypothetical protein